MDVRDSIRAGAPGDLHVVRHLVQEASLPLAGIEDHFGPSYAVAEASGRIVAVAGVESYGEGPGRDGLLRSVVVDAAWRHLGIGDALVRNRIEWARRAQLRSLWLLVTDAAEFFARYGFVRSERADTPEGIRESAEFAGACPESATPMVLALR